MRIVASVQAKRGSSRGLVHYIAHSKLDAAREPERVREIFNAFADNLSVMSANNSMRMGIAKGRPSNEELHHLVLSFRPDDYRRLGADEKRRCRALKETTRAAMRSLETALSADQLSWAAAVHLNTENPHVHIALQKRYFTRDLERQTLTRIPREALPHFESRDGERALTPGFLIDAANEKLDHMIAHNLERAQELKNGRRHGNYEPHSSGKPERENDIRVTQKTIAEREILRRGIIAQIELRRIDSKIRALTDHGGEMRFRVSDPASGRKTRLSLQDLEQRGTETDPNRMESPERQIRTILFKMLAKEETLKTRMQSDAGGTIREAERVRTEYRKLSRKLPTPSLTKDEIDKLQEICMAAADIRRFSYLEGVRSALESAGEIVPRSKDDLGRIAARKVISELTITRLKKERGEFTERQYYRSVDVSGGHISLAQLDREEKPPANPILSLLGKLKNTAERLSGVGQHSRITTESERLRNEVLRKLDEQLTAIEKDLRAEKNKARCFEKILSSEPEGLASEPLYSIEQLAETDSLSLRLKLTPVYEKNWDAQRTLIKSATSDSPAGRRLLKADPKASFSEHKTAIIAGRVLAREIVAKVEFEKAKEDLNAFTKSRRFHKFAIADRKSGSVEFLSLHDVELPSRGSVLDRALDQVFESHQHRSVRRTVSSLARAREQKLNNEVAAAKEIMTLASNDASEFKQSSLFGLRSSSPYQPIFTSSEIRLLELRVAKTRDPKEAVRLRAVLESASEMNVRSLNDILRDFETPENLPAREKEHPLAPQEKACSNRAPALDVSAREHSATDDLRPKYPGHLR